MKERALRIVIPPPEAKDKHGSVVKINDGKLTFTYLLESCTSLRIDFRVRSSLIIFKTVLDKIKSLQSQKTNLRFDLEGIGKFDHDCLNALQNL